MRPDLGFYVQTINKIVTDTEEIGEKMNPSYEEIRSAIDEGKTAELAPEKLAEIAGKFQKGTDQYAAMLKQVSGLRPPAKVMGIHKKFERSYMKYVAGCQEMIDSLQTENGLDVAAFDASEQKQDDATEEISFSIQRMTSLLLKK